MKINKIRSLIGITSLASTIFMSCISQDKNTFYYSTLPNEVWPRDSIIVFNLSDITSGSYSILLEIVYNRDYLYQDIDIASIIEYDSVQNKIFQSIPLRNDYGQLNEGGMYSYFQKNDTILKNIDFNDSINKIKINLIHTFDTDVVGINKLGIQLIKK